jgi:hypothetical protein
VDDGDDDDSKAKHIDSKAKHINQPNAAAYPGRTHAPLAEPSVLRARSRIVTSTTKSVLDFERK